MSLADDSQHGGVTDTDMERFFAEHPDLRLIQPTGDGSMSFDSAAEPPLGGDEGEPSEPESPPTEPAVEPEAEPEGAPSEGEPPGPEGEPAEPDGPTEPPAEDFFDFNGQRYTRTQIEAATAFQQHLVEDANLQNLIRNYLAGSAIDSVTSTPPASPAGEGSAPAGPPQELDLDDPQIAALYQIVQQQNVALSQLQQSQQQMFHAQQTNERQELNGIWNRVSESFGKDHSLETHDVENLARIAARLGVAPQLMSGVDPVTGSPSSPDPMKAMERSLEIAMMMVPEYRDREFQRSVITQQNEAKKRKLLGAVGGTSGSVARTTAPPQPGTPAARRAMLQEVGQMIQGEWSDPTAN